MKKDSKLNYPNFDQSLREFLDHIDSINETLPFVLALIGLVDEEKERELKDFIKSRNVKKEKAQLKDTSDTNDIKEENIISMDIQDYLVFEGLQKNAMVSSLSIKLIPESLFVSLISQFDAFIGNLVKTIFEINPEKLNTSEKNINYSKLYEFETLEQAKDYIIEKEVESVLRESHTYHFEWLEKKLDMSLRKELPIWETFIEVTERRNLFVHSHGVVTSQYLTVCKKNCVNIDEKIKIGSQLYVDIDYFKKAYVCLYELAVKLTHVVWRKLLPDDLETADSALNNICYKLLQQEDYQIADILLDFACVTLKKHFNEINKNIFIINKALSKYLSGKKQNCHQILKIKDWSACSLNFKLAIEVLNENFENAYNIMLKIGDSNDVPRHAYQSWPLFSTIRNEKRFQEIFKSTFNEEYRIIERPSPNVIKLLERKANKSSKKEQHTMHDEDAKTTVENEKVSKPKNNPTSRRRKTKALI